MTDATERFATILTALRAQTLTAPQAAAELVLIIEDIASREQVLGDGNGDEDYVWRNNRRDALSALASEIAKVV